MNDVRLPDPPHATGHPVAFIELRVNGWDRDDDPFWLMWGDSRAV